MLPMNFDRAVFGRGFLYGPALGNSAGMDQAATAAGSSDLATLLPAIASGDRAALATLYRRTSAKLFGIAVRILGDEGAAEEVLQDVFVTVWNKAACSRSAAPARSPGWRC